MRRRCGSCLRTGGEDDILLRDELDAWAQEHPGRFKVWYTIDSPGGGVESTAWGG